MKIPSERKVRKPGIRHGDSGHGLCAQPGELSSLAKIFGVELDEYNFIKTSPLSPVDTTVPGIFVCGCAESPMDVPESVAQASSAAERAAEIAFQIRFRKGESRCLKRKIKTSGSAYLSAIAGPILPDIWIWKSWTNYAETLPHVTFVQRNLYSCSEGGINEIKKGIAEHNLNRVVVASCTPRTHEPLFRSSCDEAGLNPYLFEMVNIRDQCSWVHMQEQEDGTTKAKDLIRMGVAKAALLEPQDPIMSEVCARALVIGGGIAGMTASAGPGQSWL